MVHVIGFFGPDTYTLALQGCFKCNPAVNVKHLKPYYACENQRASLGPVSNPGQEGEKIMERLLNRKRICGHTHYLMLWKVCSLSLRAIIGFGGCCLYGLQRTPAFEGAFDNLSARARKTSKEDLFAFA